MMPRRLPRSWETLSPPAGTLHKRKEAPGGEGPRSLVTLLGVWEVGSPVGLGQTPPRKECVY